MNVSVAVECGNILGEGPVWHKGRSSFFWVDIEGKLLQQYSLTTGQICNWNMPAPVGMVAAINNDELIIALQGAVVIFNLNDASIKPHTPLEAENSMMRPNDGKCDSRGRLWVGTTQLNHAEPVGNLYMLEGNTIGKKHSGLTISNGMAWSADNSRFYFIDTPLQRIDAFIFDEEKADIRFEKTVIHVPAGDGQPDGMTIDAEGMLWVALWGGFAVKRYNPFTGKLLETISMPVPNVTSCAFGGENLDQLFISTARKQLNEEQLKQYPLSGHAFICNTAIRGTQPFYFKK
ncbi:MAG TPA: SMP-30/gluconolactonase/LRE family protein [Panacibacter sp.]|nr:SMP-30/gluconolactonase/LRE family protein [Panacibacter sp.]